MDTLYPCCAGLDVHKRTVVACVRRLLPGGHVPQQLRTFPTTTRHLDELAAWLHDAGVTHVAMESTGVSWKPVWNRLEAAGAFTLLLVNAHHVKQVPGRKTDVKDCQWLAELLQHGLLKPSFVPPEPVRRLRELTRQRTQAVRAKAAVANRIQKALEDANVKIGGVASDVLGKSGRATLRAIARGQGDPGVLAELARGRLRAKIPQLQEALAGRITDHHRFLLGTLLDHVEHLDRLIDDFSTRLTAVLTPPFVAAVKRLQTVPGIDRRAAEVIVAELGADMTPFPSAAHLASWVGVCPGDHESAGKRRSGRATPGNAWLRVTLVQAAWGASRTTGPYLMAQYQRLAARRGKKRALLAVAHTLAGIIYQVLKSQAVYKELGPDYLAGQDAAAQTRRLVARLEGLGHKVSLETREAPV
jgi:transposase